jgi:hypothetical protein
MPATTDRGDILHLAGRARRSPALEGASPRLVAGGEGGATRCGWAPFFRALAASGLAVAWRGDAPDDLRMVARAEARRDPPHRASLRRALADAGRIVRALRG